MMFNGVLVLDCCKVSGCSGNLILVACKDLSGFGINSVRGNYEFGLHAVCGNYES